jgi:hypothetical protein
MRLVVPEFPQFPQRIRMAAGVAAMLLLVVFFLPRGGVFIWQLLPKLHGMDFLRLWFLGVAGVVLGAAALLPVPPLFRSVLGVASLFVWLAIGAVPLQLALRTSIGAVASLLCSSLLVRSHMPWAQTPRRVGIAMVLLVVGLYLWPFTGALPIVKTWSMLFVTTDPASRFIAIYLLLPVPVVLLATLVHVGSELAALGETLAWLVFMWGPGALLILSIEPSQIYASITTFATLIAASYGLAEPLQELTLRRDGY